jgi:signal transduction histidine kinase
MRLAPLLFTLLLVPAPLIAQEAKDAEAFVKEAVAFCKANGREAFFKEVNFGAGRFNLNGKKTLYISVYDTTGKVVAHGASPNKIGSNAMGSKDPNGKLYVKERIDLVKAKGKGWVDYIEINPVDKKAESKTSYVEGIEDLVVSCGIYKKS